jgi:Cft2 family RNA processing exonuclease
MRARLGGQRLEHTLAFGEPREFTGAELPFRITLLPAGHILGSAMAFIEAASESLLYTGDFKLKPGFAVETCAPRRADVLVMESTFGQPHYQFPPAHAVLADIVQFCRESIADGGTAVLLAYSLGKTQELLAGLAGTGLSLAVAAPAWKLNQVYESCGVHLPAVTHYEGGAVPGKVLICPQAGDAGWRSNPAGCRVATVTGWAMDAGCRFRHGVDAAFPLSDHADFPDLLRLVELVSPRRIFTVHGFAADLARVLRERGWDARALGETEQLDLDLGVEDRPRRKARPSIAPLCT